MNYLFNVAGPNEYVVRLGIGVLCELAENAGADQMGLLVPVFSVLEGMIRPALGGDTRALRTGNHRMQIEFGDNTYWLIAMSNRTKPHQFDGPVLAAFTRPADAIGVGDINGCACAPQRG